jgi:hypothetical protein
VTFTLTGSASDSTLSDVSGNYSFPSLSAGGSYIVTPTKSALTPGFPDINLLDVIAAQRHFLGIGTPLAGCQLTAADVNGDTSIDVLDVIAIQRFFLGRSTGIARTGNYQFTPANRSYPGVVTDQTGQNYDTLIFGNVVGPFADRSVLEPNANGPVWIVVAQPDGKILVGGDFTTLSPNGGVVVTRNHIARLDATTGLADSFDPNANGGVNSIAVKEDGSILVGGDFTSIGGQTRNSIARLDATTGLADSLFDPNANGGVNSIAVQPDGRILAGGAFTKIGGEPRNHIARLDATTGLADSFNPNANGGVNSVAVREDGSILVDGDFTSIGGQPRNSIARLDATTGLADSFDWDASTNVRSIVLRAAGASGGEVPAMVAAVALPEIVVDESKSNFIAAVRTSDIEATSKLVGFQGDFTFDERVVAFQSEPVRKAGVTGGNWNVSGNVLPVLPGGGPIRTLRIAAFSNDFTPLSGSGTLFELRITRVSKAGQGTQLLWAAPPDQFIFIDADLKTQAPVNAAPGNVTPSGKRR